MSMQLCSFPTDYLTFCIISVTVQCFDAVGWASGRVS